MTGRKISRTRDSGSRASAVPQHRIRGGRQPPGRQLPHVSSLRAQTRQLVPGIRCQKVLLREAEAFCRRRAALLAPLALPGATPSKGGFSIQENTAGGDAGNLSGGPHRGSARMRRQPGSRCLHDPRPRPGNRQAAIPPTFMGHLERPNRPCGRFGVATWGLGGGYRRQILAQPRGGKRDRVRHGLETRVVSRSTWAYGASLWRTKTVNEDLDSTNVAAACAGTTARLRRQWHG